MAPVSRTSGDQNRTSGPEKLPEIVRRAFRTLLIKTAAGTQVA